MRPAAHEFAGQFHLSHAFLRPIAEVVNLEIHVGYEPPIIGRRRFINKANMAVRILPLELSVRRGILMPSSPLCPFLCACGFLLLRLSHMDIVGLDAFESELVDVDHGRIP